MKTTCIMLGLLLTLAAATPARAQISAFTYQGRLNLNGAPANGHYDFMFRLLNDATSGVAAPVIPVALAVPVSNGLFTTGMDFGAENFDGANRWLEINVRTNGSGSFTTLSPRQLLTPAPYAIQAVNAASSASVSGSVSAAQLTGTISSNNIGAGSITTEMLMPGAVGSNQLAAGAVTTTALADGAVTAAKVATVSNWFALTIANPTPATSDDFGRPVAAVGPDRVLIGADGDDTGAINGGAAYLFNTNGALLTTFTNPTPAAGDLFGVSVAAVGTDQVLIGADSDDTGAEQAGAAYLFNTEGALLTTFTNPTPEYGDYFGYSVAAVGTDRVLIGAFGDNTGAYAAGVAYLFSTSGALLATFTNPTPADFDLFGFSVAALGSDRVLIGALGDGTGAYNVGAAYLFSLESFTPGLVANRVSAGSITTASLQDGVVTLAKLDPTIGVWTRAGDDVFRLVGNVGIGTSSFTSNRLQVAGMVGATAFNSTSDRAAKQDFTAVDAQAVLDKLTALPITQWRFRDFPGALHLGPTAQDFRAAFGLGLDDLSIATVDADGVALAAIQGLNQKLEETRAENAELRKRLTELEGVLRGLVEDRR